MNPNHFLTEGAERQALFCMHSSPVVRIISALMLAAALMPGSVFANQPSQPYSVPANDAPSLAAIGPHAVGWRTLSFTNPEQPDIPKMVLTAGKTTKSDRTLKIEVWYPATVSGTPAPARYVAPLPRSKEAAQKVEFAHTGIAIPNAAPVAGSKFPLVLVSHGFGGWGTFMTYLTENLASKGYVVVAIDHADAPFTDAGSFGLSFGSTIVHRARDQQFVLGKLVELSKAPNEPLGALIDAQSIGVIGYSMGGFGALATAGAGYDAASATFRQIPAPLMAPLTEGNAEFAATRPANVKALVLIAPWGAQPAQHSWSAKSLESLRTPLMMVVGDADDIVDRANGVGYLFDNTKSASRHLLVYQNARHNTGGNPAPVEALNDFVAREYFDEPVWRKDRISAINQHFITAFLDLHLKANAARAAFLDVAPVKSNDGKWEVAPGQRTNDTVASGSGETALYWRGFQRRWALGLEMYRKKAGE